MTKIMFMMSFLVFGFINAQAQSESVEGTQPPLAEKGCSQLHIYVNQSAKKQTLSAECDGVEVLAPVLTSTGKGRSTPYGTFEVYNKLYMAYSKSYNNAPMARMLVFHSCKGKPNCIGVHATVKSNYKYLGSPASHGCVRLTMKNAQILWDFANVSETVLVTVQ